MNLALLYKDKCHKDGVGQIDYEKELGAMMLLDKQKLVDFISHVDSKAQCLKIKDATIGKDCETFVKEIEMEIVTLCPVIHQDL